MGRYRVSFLNELPNASGYVSRCRRRVIEIRAARSKQRAVEAAKRRFARQEAVSVWRIRARFIEVEEFAGATP